MNSRQIILLSSLTVGILGGVLAAHSYSDPMAWGVTHGIITINKGCPLPDTTVKAIALRDAGSFKDATEEMDKEGIILDIRARESLMRQNGLNATADLYISTVRQHIDQ